MRVSRPCIMPCTAKSGAKSFGYLNLKEVELRKLSSFVSRLILAVCLFLPSLRQEERGENEGRGNERKEIEFESRLGSECVVLGISI